MNLPLQGIRVLDLTHALAGPYAAMILADLGADVVKVESVASGDVIRDWGMRVGGESTFYLCANRNKRTVALNYRDPTARQALRTMAANSDVLLENFRPGTIEKMGLGYDALRKENQRLIFGSVSGFGRQGPRASDPGFDVIAQALSGVMSINGTDAGGPLRVGLPLGDIGAGMWLALGVVAAVRQRDATGVGQRVDTSLLSTLISMLCHHAQAFLAAGEVPGRTGNSHPTISPYGAFQAKDELLAIAPAKAGMWSTFCRILRLEYLVEHEDFASPQLRIRNSARLKDLIEARLVDDTASNWAEKLVSAGIPAGRINSLDKSLTDPQVEACGMIESIPHPTLGTWKAVASPIRFSSLGDAPSTRSVPPQPGQHSVECLRERGVGEAVIERLLSSGALWQAPGGEPSAVEAAADGGRRG